MILSTLRDGTRYGYEQPKLPWYKRIVGMKYGPGWSVFVTDSKSITESEVQDESPNPALVMEVLLDTIDEHEKQ